MNATAKAKAKANEEKSVVPYTAQQAHDALNEIHLTGNSTSGITESQALEILENMPDAALREMTSEYFDFSVAGKFTFIFEGVEKATISGKEIDIVQLRDKDNKRWIAGGAVLVNTCKRLTQIPSYIRVITTGKKIQSAKGDYYEMRVLTFEENQK